MRRRRRRSVSWLFLFLLEGFTRICFDVKEEEEEETRSELRGEVVGVKRWCHIFFTVLYYCACVSGWMVTTASEPRRGKVGPTVQ